MFSLVYQPSLFKNTLFVYLDPSAKPTHSKSIDQVTYVFHDDTCIGINMFNLSQSLMDLLTDGIQRNVNKDVILFIQQSIERSPFKIDLGPFQSGFVIGEIIEKDVHPESEHLLVCQVNVGTIIQVVTNAIQLKVNDKIVVALPGAMTALGVWITETSMLKVKSTGMFCSEKTLGLKQTQPGVLVLDSFANVGKDFYENLRN